MSRMHCHYIAHRLTTIRDADRIAVIQNGELVELGNHDTLITKGGFYASLYQAYEENTFGASSNASIATPQPTLRLVTG